MTFWGLLALGCQRPDLSVDPPEPPAQSGHTGIEVSDSTVDPTRFPRCADPGPDAPVVPRIGPTMGEFEGSEMLTWLPEGLPAVVFYFYGGEEVDEWTGPEQTAFMNQLVDAGIGYVAYSKGDPTPGASWDKLELDWDTNLDLPRLERLRAELVATTALAEGTPILSTGFSDGAAFSLFFATQTRSQRGWPVVAVLAHNTGGADVALPDVPIWITANEFDEPNLLLGAEALAERHRADGYEATFVRVDERTLTAETLLRRPEWDEADAGTMYQDLVDHGLVDAMGTRLVPDDEMVDKLDAYGEAAELEGAAISTQRARVVWATHRYSALNTVAECEFALGILGL